MKKLFLILSFITTFCYCQTSGRDWSDVGHFYGSCLINLTSYKTQALLMPKQKPAPRFLISFLVTEAAGVGKEIYDLKKNNIPVKFKNLNFNDIAVDNLGNFTAVYIQLVINDQKKRKGFIDYWN